MKNNLSLTVQDKKKFDEDSFKTKELTSIKGVQSVSGRLKDSTDTTFYKFIFDETWKKDKAMKWIEENLFEAVE